MIEIPAVVFYQFTYAFAEAQTRLLGVNAQTIGRQPATPAILRQAAKRVMETLDDKDYLAACAEAGKKRFGPPGASMRLAQLLLTHLGEGSEAETDVKI